MAKIKLAGSALVVTSTIKTEDLKEVKKYEPKMLKLVEEESTVFAVDLGGSATLNELGALFNETSYDGFAQMTLKIETPNSSDEAKKLVLDTFGRAISRLNKVEEQIEQGLASIEREKNSVSYCVEVL